MDDVWTKGELLFIILSTVKHVWLPSTLESSYVLQQRFGLLLCLQSLSLCDFEFSKENNTNYSFQVKNEVLYSDLATVTCGLGGFSKEALRKHLCLCPLNHWMKSLSEMFAN